MSTAGPQRVWMDQGGTFTDVLTVGPDGQATLRKVLTSDADLGALAAGDPAPRRGTTAATNALLEGRGAPTLLITTAGFADIEHLGDGRRGALFSLDPPPRPVLAACTLAVPGRILASGALAPPVDLAAARAGIAAARARHGVTAAAVVLVHGPKAPDEERKLGRLCAELGLQTVSLGHEIAPSEGFLARVHTTLADARLGPLLPRAPGSYLRSDGGRAAHDSPDWRGSSAILSGPAGGVVAAHALRAAWAPRPVAFTFDMGGTSTDTAAVGDRLRRRDHLEVAGLRLRLPAVALHTVAAGGGSRLRHQGGLYQVGPDSAGARPGPACYGRGGPPTVTDCEAVLGRLPDFPAVCGPAADQPLDLAAARAALQALDPDRSVEAIATDFRAVAHATMARAVQALAAARGLDPRDGALVAFGGAGPGHATGVARQLGIDRVVLPLLAGGFSAVGVGIAGERRERVWPLDRGLAAVLAALPSPPAAPPTLQLGCRVVGTGALLPLELGPDELADLAARAPAGAGLPRLPPGALRDRFDALHAQELGFARPDQPVELVELRVATTTPTGPLPPVRPRAPAPPRRVRAWFDGPCDVPLIDIFDTANLEGLTGPALVRGPGCTVVIERGWSVRCAPHCLLLDDHQPTRGRLGTAADPRDTAIFGARLAAVAEQMGARLARLARSVSIRERQDFSCAVFDAAGRLVANAPHVPVHLGAMGESLRALMARGPLAPGEVWATNDPYRGGSHLPDITVVAPVHADDGTLLGHVGCRGHHIDVGGSQPGSMPAHAEHIDEEGILIEAHRLVHLGRLVPPPLPGCREPETVVADLEAQVAACAAGRTALRQLDARLGPGVLSRQLVHLHEAARASGAAVLARLLAGLPAEVCAEERLDDGTRLTLRLRATPGGATVAIDAPAHPGNRNTPAAVARAVLLYVLRCLQPAGLPLSEGTLAPVTLSVSPGGLLAPQWPAAVAGGNVETSQRLADALLRALGLSAASQGTMNNLTVGTAAGAWYETIAGGMGAGPGRAGRSAVQVHMTNTRATDVEALERRFPVLLRRLARRQGSGGAGRWPGGDGIEKEWEFQEDVVVSMMAERRRAGAPGAAGGAAGLPGEDAVWEPGPVAAWRPLVGTAALRAGARLRVRTPGGGGWGPPPAPGPT